MLLWLDVMFGFGLAITRVAWTGPGAWALGNKFNLTNCLDPGWARACVTVENCNVLIVTVLMAIPLYRPRFYCLSFLPDFFL